MKPELAARTPHSYHKKTSKMKTLKFNACERWQHYFALEEENKNKNMMACFSLSWRHINLKSVHIRLLRHQKRTYLFLRQTKWSAPKAVNIRSLRPMEVSNIPLITWLTAIILQSSSDKYFKIVQKEGQMHKQILKNMTWRSQQRMEKTNTMSDMKQNIYF